MGQAVSWPRERCVSVASALVRDISVRAVAVLGAGAMLAACQVGRTRPIRRRSPRAVMDRIVAIGSTPTSPIFIRMFKEEASSRSGSAADGTYALLETYGICTWSGELGPKLAEGDRQAPEGFYTVTPAQMNPKSSYYLSFNIGFPNAYDRALGRTGSHLMVHGACSSAGCYSMTDETVEISTRSPAMPFAAASGASTFRPFRSG